MTQEIAHAKAMEYLLQSWRVKDDEPLIMRIQEEDFGWIVFYNSKRYVIDGEVSSRMIGNAPLIIDRDDYSVYVTGTAEPLEMYIDLYLAGKTKKT